MASEKVIIIYGNPADGLACVGPFDNTEDAINYAQTCRNIRNETWWVIGLETPTL